MYGYSIRARCVLASSLTFFFRFFSLYHFFYCTIYLRPYSSLRVYSSRCCLIQSLPPSLPPACLIQSLPPTLAPLLPLLPLPLALLLLLLLTTRQAG